MAFSFGMFHLFPSIFCIYLSCSNDELFVIRSIVYEDMVLDGSDSKCVLFRTYKNSSSQLWEFQPVDSPGLFYIINNQTKKALEYFNYADLATNDKVNGLKQQWSLILGNISDNNNMYGRIKNAENHNNISSESSSCTPEPGGIRVFILSQNDISTEELVVSNYKATELAKLLENIENEEANSEVN